MQPIGGCSPDVYSWDKRATAVRAVMSFLNHPGLAFLGANVPCDILEYPTAGDFERALADPPEVLGISFYINETGIACRMADRARARGVKEVWAGNFGAYSPAAAPHFDRVITGWGESAAAAALGHEPVPAARLVHPPMYGAVGSNLFPRYALCGTLFTSRGCPFTCNYCQTPDFYGAAHPVPLESIERVLWTYHRQGIRGINILDENFGILPVHARAVIELLHKYEMRWVALCRVDLLLANFEAWREKGLFGAHLGVESLNQRSLATADKKLNQSKTIQLLRLMSRHNLFVQSFYIVGFEDETVDTVKEDIRELARLDVDMAQVQVITPYPRTGMRDRIESEYGIHDHDLSHYNSRHLVWNHPHIEPAQMKELRAWANARLSGSRRSLRTLSKIFLFHGTAQPHAGGLRLLRDAWSHAAHDVYRRHARGLRNARRWARSGWWAYEESSPADLGPREPRSRRGACLSQPRNAPRTA